MCKQVEIAEAGFASALGRAAFALRVEVFVHEQKVPLEEEQDAYDADALHLVVVEEGAVVGTCRLVMLEGGRVKIGRVAVRRDRRGTGVGRVLMEAAIRKAWDRGAVELVLTAQVPVIGFYEKLGFVITSDVFMEAGIPHKAMVCRRTAVA